MQARIINCIALFGFTVWVFFEQIGNDETTHGNYTIFLINVDCTEEFAITDKGYSQGIPVWSHSGEQIVFVVGIIGTEGKFGILIDFHLKIFFYRFNRFLT